MSAQRYHGCASTVLTGRTGRVSIFGVALSSVLLTLGKESLMKAGFAAIGLVWIAAGSLMPQQASAQAPQQQQYAACRHEAATKNIMGDAYGAFLDECMMRPASASTSDAGQMSTIGGRAA
jgi:hypothetical protein